MAANESTSDITVIENMTDYICINDDLDRSFNTDICSYDDVGTDENRKPYMNRSTKLVESKIKDPLRRRSYMSEEDMACEIINLQKKMIENSTAMNSIFSQLLPLRDNMDENKKKLEDICSNQRQQCYKISQIEDVINSLQHHYNEEKIDKQKFEEKKILWQEEIEKNKKLLQEELTQEMKSLFEVEMKSLRQQFIIKQDYPPLPKEEKIELIQKFQNEKILLTKQFNEEKENLQEQFHNNLTVLQQHFNEEIRALKQQFESYKLILKEELVDIFNRLHTNTYDENKSDEETVLKESVNHDDVLVFSDVMTKLENMQTELKEIQMITETVTARMTCFELKVNEQTQSIYSRQEMMCDEFQSIHEKLDVIDMEIYNNRLSDLERKLVVLDLTVKNVTEHHREIIRNLEKTYFMESDSRKQLEDKVAELSYALSNQEDLKEKVNSLETELECRIDDVISDMNEKIFDFQNDIKNRRSRN